MPLYEGIALFSVAYKASADDEIQAVDFIAEMAREEFPDMELDNVIKIKEVEVK